MVSWDHTLGGGGTGAATPGANWPRGACGMGSVGGDATPGPPDQGPCGGGYGSPGWYDVTSPPLALGDARCTARYEWAATGSPGACATGSPAPRARHHGSRHTATRR